MTKSEIDSLLDKEIRLEQIKRLYENISLLAFGTVIASSAYVYILTDITVSRANLNIWYFTILAITGARLWDARCFKESEVNIDRLDYWEYRFIFLSTSAAVTWGLLAWTGYSEKPEYQAMLMIFIVGVTGIAISTLSYRWYAISLFLTSVITIIWLRMLFETSLFSTVITYLISIYLFISLISSRRFYINSHTNIRLKLEADFRENYLRDLKNEAERSNAAKTEFLSNMSHELRTPLNAILGYTQLVQHDATLADKHKEQICEINMAGRHLLTLVNQILDLARIEGRKSNLHIIEINADNVITECIAFTRTMAIANSIDVTADLDKTALVMADGVALKQIMLNLISNAIKYNQPSGTVTLTCKPTTDNHIQFNITDTGQGIDEQGLQEIFEPFNRLGAQDTGIEGTGIGLAITRDLITEMGGQIGIESTPGVGSTFWFELPGRLVERNDTDSTGDIDDTILAVSPAVPTDGKILVVEDNITNQLLLQNQLSRLGYECEVADNGKIALDLLSDKSYILILTDCNMPVMNGYQLATAVRQKDTITPIIGITADAFPESEERCLSAGMTGRITKPVELQTLKDMLDRTLITASSKLVNAVG